MIADISSYIESIQTASRGEEVRDSIVNALIAINNAIDSSVNNAVTNVVSDLANADEQEY